VRARLATWLGAHRAEALLALLLLSSYGYFYPSLGHNEAARLDLMRALVEDGSLAVDRFRYNSADLVVYAGRTYSNKAPGTSFLALPAFAFWRWALSRWPLPGWAYWDALAHLTTLSSVGLASTLAALLSFGLVRAVSADAQAALGAILALWLGTILFPFSTALFGHALAASLVAMAFALLFRVRRQQLPAWRSAGLAGLLSGAAIATEYPTALLVGLFALYALTLVGRGRAGVLAAAAFGLALGVGLAALLLYNYAAFGQALFPSYQAYVEQGSRAPFAAHALGYAGVHWPGLGAFCEVLREITIAPQRGLLYCNPVLWLAAPGLLVMARRAELRAEAALIAAAVAMMLAFNACYGDSILYWGGGASIGARHLAPLLPLLALPLALVARRWAWLFVPLLLVSCFFMLLATAIEPRVPYEYRNPFFEFLVPSYLRGRLALHRGALFDPDARWSESPAGAFNLGGLLGLPGSLQLLPGLLLAAGIGRALWSELAPRARATTGVLGALVLGVALPPLLHSLTAPGLQRGLLGESFQNDRWAGPPVELRQDAILDLDFRDEPAFPPPMSARWQGALRIATAGTYLIRLEADDEAFLELDGRLVATGRSAEPRSRPGAWQLGAGVHPLTLRLVNRSGWARVRLLWKPPRGRETVVPASALGP
jgi:hypothetical protein